MKLLIKIPDLKIEQVLRKKHQKKIFSHDSMYDSIARGYQLIERSQETIPDQPLRQKRHLHTKNTWKSPFEHRSQHMQNQQKNMQQAQHKNLEKSL